MLRGNHIAKVDQKGRLKLPAPFRAAIEPVYGTDFFVTSLRGESVRVYPMEAWYRVEEKLARAPSLDPAVIRFKNAVNFYGQCAAMDSQGRLLVHQLLREKAGIRGEVAVLGQQDYLEVWNRSAFEERLANDPLTDADQAALARFGI